MDIYAEFFRRVLFPQWEGTIRKRPTLSLLRHLEETQWRPLAELEAMQMGALRRLLRHSYDHVPFYRQALDEAGLTPELVRSIEDVRKIPILTRELAQRAGETRASRAAPLPVIKKGTSGTMGQPLSFAYDLGSEHWRSAVRMRGYGWAGLTPGVPSFHYWGSVGRLKRESLFRRAKVAADRALKRETYVDCTSRNETEMDSVIKQLSKQPPKVMLIYAQAGADLARRVNETCSRAWSDISVISGAERLFPADRIEIERAFGPVFETYGSREVMLMASECERHQGMHISHENILFEIIVRDPKGDRPARPGEVGEVVVTDLHNFGMPFVRYANGDLAMAMEPSACPCGRTLPRIAHVDGRVTETLRGADGGRVSGLVFNVLLAVFGDAIRKFQAVQHKDRSLTLRLVATDAFDESAEKRLRTTLASYFGELPLTIERVAELAVDASGKRRVVVVEKLRVSRSTAARRASLRIASGSFRARSRRD